MFFPTSLLTSYIKYTLGIWVHQQIQVLYSMSWPKPLPIGNIQRLYSSRGSLLMRLTTTLLQVWMLLLLIIIQSIIILSFLCRWPKNSKYSWIRAIYSENQSTNPSIFLNFISFYLFPLNIGTLTHFSCWNKLKKY